LTLWFAEKNGGKSGCVNYHILPIIILPSLWKPMLIVAKDFIRSAGIQNRQLIHPPKNVFQLAGHNLTSALLPESFKAFFQGFLDRGCQGLSGLGCDLSGQPLSLYALDTNRHNPRSIPL
jgi:hypothetical protein